MLSVITVYSVATYAEEQPPHSPLWELNLAAGFTAIPHYIGSDEQYRLNVIFPYFIYRGEHIQADKQGVRSRFLENGNLSMDMNFSFRLPVSNNVARQAMPDLGLVGQIGPQFNWLAYQDNHAELSAHLPFRVAVDHRQTFLGWVAEPAIRYAHHFDDSEGVSLAIKAGALYASKQYGAYYYGVTPAYATALRPVYRAQQGMHYTFLKTSLAVRHSPTLFSGILLTARALHEGVIADSPLVKEKLYLSIGAALTWTFMTSAEPAGHSLE